MVLIIHGVTCKKEIDRIYLRSDRALASANWIEHYRETRVHHLVDSTSDHCALLITDSMPQ